MWRVLAFLAWPVCEIALFVVIGGEIGLWATLAWVLGTAVVGIFLLRSEAERGASLLRGGMGQMKLPQGAALGGLFRALAAMLLILPGFLTDAIGLLLLLPPLQKVLAATAARRVVVMQAGMQANMASGMANGRAARPAAMGDDFIDGEWVEVPPEAQRNRRASGWTEAQIEAQLVDDEEPPAARGR